MKIELTKRVLEIVCQCPNISKHISAEVFCNNNYKETENQFSEEIRLLSKESSDKCTQEWDKIAEDIDREYNLFEHEQHQAFIQETLQDKEGEGADFVMYEVGNTEISIDDAVYTYAELSKKEISAIAEVLKITRGQCK